jgi:hypothetical protein
MFMFGGIYVELKFHMWLVFCEHANEILVIYEQYTNGTFN